MAAHALERFGFVTERPAIEQYLRPAPRALEPSTVGDVPSTSQLQSFLSDPNNIPPQYRAQYAQALSQTQSGDTLNAITTFQAMASDPQGFFADSSNEPRFMAALAEAFSAGGQPEIGAAILLLDQLAHGIADLAAAIWPPPPPCTTGSGPPLQVADVLAAWGYNGGTDFARIAVPAIAKVWADTANCVSTITPAMALEALVSWWNSYGGTTQSVFVPGILGMQAIVFVGYDTNASDTQLQIPWAFQPDTFVPVSVEQLAGDFGPFSTRFVELGPGPQDTTAPCASGVVDRDGNCCPSGAVDANGNCLPAAPTPTPTSSTPSAGATVATVGLVGVALAGGAWLALGRPDFTWDAIKAAWQAMKD
jgi:hypothetical protein